VLDLCIYVPFLCTRTPGAYGQDADRNFDFITNEFKIVPALAEHNFYNVWIYLLHDF